jgi:hypothetical protein
VNQATPASSGSRYHVFSRRHVLLAGGSNQTSALRFMQRPRFRLTISLVRPYLDAQYAKSPRPKLTPGCVLA